MSDQLDPPWSPRDKDQHLIDAIIANTTATSRVCLALEQVAGTLTGLTALMLRLEAKFDAGPAE